MIPEHRTGVAKATLQTKQQTSATRENEGGFYATQCPWTDALRRSTVRWCDSEELRPPHTLAASTNVAFMIGPAKNLLVGTFESTSCGRQCEKNMKTHADIESTGTTHARNKTTTQFQRKILRSTSEHLWID